MPDPNTEHGLRVQLATALLERDDYKEAYRRANEEVWKLRAEVKRLRKVLDLYRSCRHACQECFCVKEARAALCTGGDRG